MLLWQILYQFIWHLKREELKGIFVVFEGLDGSGKSTQAIRLFERLKRRHIPSSLHREPGGTILGEEVRKIVKKGNLGNPVSEVLLFNASRASLINEQIKPALKTGQVVICDRFSASTIAYQGFGRDVNIQDIEQINHYATKGLTPTLTFLLDIDPTISLQRLKLTRLHRDHYEKEQLSFHQKVREGYLKLARNNLGEWKILDGTQDPRILAISIWRQIYSLLPNAN